MARFPRTVRRSWENPEFRGLAAITALALVSGTLFYWQVEGWSVLDSIYFSVITLTTVGYGDLAPTTAAGKVFTIFYGFAVRAAVFGGGGVSLRGDDSPYGEAVGPRLAVF